MFFQLFLEWPNYAILLSALTGHFPVNRYLLHDFKRLFIRFHISILIKAGSIEKHIRLKILYLLLLTLF